MAGPTQLRRRVQPRANAKKITKRETASAGIMYHWGGVSKKGGDVGGRKGGHCGVDGALRLFINRFQLLKHPTHPPQHSIAH